MRSAPRSRPASRRAWLVLPPDAPAVSGTALNPWVLPQLEMGGADAVLHAIAARLRAQLSHDPRAKPRAILFAANAALPTPAALPGPTLHGVPLALLPADSSVDVRAAPAASAPIACAVLSMWSPQYLAWGARLTAAAQAGAARAPDSGAPRVIAAWPATEVLRGELCAHLADGPALAIYVGHGRERGWTGYRGVRWRHIDAVRQQRPITALLGFTCRNLCAPAAAEPSFGEQWVLSGRAHAFFGAVDGVELRALERMGTELAQLLARGRLHDLAHIVSWIDRRLRRSGDAAALAAWRRFRIFGNPLIPLP